MLKAIGDARDMAAHAARQRRGEVRVVAVRHARGRVWCLALVFDWKDVLF
jgi:hypothetical protein